MHGKINLTFIPLIIIINVWARPYVYAYNLYMLFFSLLLIYACITQIFIIQMKITKNIKRNLKRVHSVLLQK
jgi:hypothetical protein